MILKILSLLILIFAFYLFVIGAMLTISSIEIVHSGVKTNGKIISSYKEFNYTTQTSSRRSGTSHYHLRPIIHYSVNGSKFEIHGKILGEIGIEYQIGQSIPLLYLPKNPDYAKINSFFELWYEPLKEILLSVLLFFLGIYLKSILHYLKQKINNSFQIFNFPSQ